MTQRGVPAFPPGYCRRALSSHPPGEGGDGHAPGRRVSLRTVALGYEHPPASGAPNLPPGGGTTFGGGAELPLLRNSLLRPERQPCPPRGEERRVTAGATYCRASDDRSHLLQGGGARTSGHHLPRPARHPLPCRRWRARQDNRGAARRLQEVTSCPPLRGPGHVSEHDTCCVSRTSGVSTLSSVSRSAPPGAPPARDATPPRGADRRSHRTPQGKEPLGWGRDEQYR